MEYLITFWKAASSWISTELFSQICFSFHKTFLGWYSTNHFRALLHPLSQNLVCSLLLMTVGSSWPAAFVLMPDAHHCGRGPGDRMFMEVWFLQRIQVLTIPLIVDIERVVQRKLPKYPFVWCTSVYSIYVPLLTCSPWVPWLIFVCYPLTEWILSAFPGYNLPGFQITTGPTTVDWRKGWEKHPATIFGIYHFIFGSSSKGCWHSLWAASLYFKLSWSPLTVDQAFISSIYWYFCSIAGKELEL